jgi:hypothetical protein
MVIDVVTTWGLTPSSTSRFVVQSGLNPSSSPGALNAKTLTITRLMSQFGWKRVDDVYTLHDKNLPRGPLSVANYHVPNTQMRSPVVADTLSGL